MPDVSEINIGSINFTRAVVCFFVKEELVLLIHRKKVSDGLGEDLVSGIGGKVGDKPEFANETIEEALVREVKEEIGVTPTKFEQKGNVKFVWETKPNWNMDVAIFVVTEWEGELIETVAARPIWHELSNLPINLMWEDNRYWVPNVLAGAAINAVFIYGAEKTLKEYTLNYGIEKLTTIFPRQK